MAVNCIFDFDNNPEGTFYAGQVLSGKVTLEVQKPKQLNGIRLEVSGFAHTSWDESESRTVSSANGHSKTETTTVNYSGNEDYISTRTFLLGSQDAHAVLLEPGVHVYTFACHIPPVCPSSFEGSYGHIRYKVKVVLMRPWKFDQTFTKGFTVLHILDLNYEGPLLKMPANASAEKIFCCGPCKSDPLKIVVRIPQSGYVPGQKIPVAVLVANESSIAVKEIKLALAMMICYRSEFPLTDTKNERVSVTKLNGGSVVLRHCNKFFNYELEVPATPASCNNLCRLIHISYQMEVELKMPGTHPNQVVCIPVTIGNVPMLQGGVIDQQPTSSSSGMQRALMTTIAEAGASSEKTLGDASSTAITLPWTENANIPPPSYQAANHIARATINENEAHDYGQSDFAPRYPVFSVPSPAAPIIDVIERNAV